MRVPSPRTAGALHPSSSEDSALLRCQRARANPHRRVTFAIDVESAPSRTGLPQAALDALSVTRPPFEGSLPHRRASPAGLSQTALDTLSSSVPRVNLSGSGGPSAGLAQGALDTLRVEEGLPQKHLDALCVCSAGGPEFAHGEGASTHHVCASVSVHGRGSLKVSWTGPAPPSVIHLSAGSPARMPRIGRGGA